MPVRQAWLDMLKDLSQFVNGVQNHATIIRPDSGRQWITLRSARGQESHAKLRGQRPREILIRSPCQKFEGGKNRRAGGERLPPQSFADRGHKQS